MLPVRLKPHFSYPMLVSTALGVSIPEARRITRFLLPTPLLFSAPAPRLHAYRIVVGLTTHTTTRLVMINAAATADTRATLPRLAGNLPRMIQNCGGEGNPWSAAIQSTKDEGFWGEKGKEGGIRATSLCPQSSSPLPRLLVVCLPRGWVGGGGGGPRRT